MKLTIHREALLSPLQAIAGVVERKQTMPVLSNVLLIAEGDSLTLTGTNMEVELVAKVDEVTIDQPGRITVSARKLSDICRALPEGMPVELAMEGERVRVRSGASQFTLATLPAEHFPNVEDEPESFRVSLAQTELNRLLDATSFAMAQQDVRYYLNGLLLEVGNDLIRAVATDGHRLAMGSIPVTTGTESLRQVILPRKGVQELGRLLEESDEAVVLVFGENHLRATIGAYTFTSKLIEGKFPDYNRVIPRGGDKVMEADRKSLKATLQRAGILSHENIRGVRLHFENDQLHVYANNPDQEQAEDTVPVSYQAEPLQIGFNVGYLIDVLNVLSSDSVRFTLSNANSSVLVDGEADANSVYVVMPMRL